MNLQPAPSPYRADPQIASLGEKIGDPVRAAEFPKAILRYRNDRWAQAVGLENLTDAEWISHFARFEPLPDNLPQPLALRYHGHQFRHYNPNIGDGRGFLCAQMRDHLGRLLDLGTKGSGTTPYSRDGDGRLTLKGAVREILATEMLEALGVETSKTFSVIETGEDLIRGDEPSPTRSAVLVRLSHSHIRIGAFQRIAYEDDAFMMQRLVGYCLDTLYDVPHGDIPAATLLNLAVERIASQAASYMVAGFVHGVLNSDNINITGESFDYGPWRFTQFWDPAFTAAYFDHEGLYAFGRQAEAMHWDLAQLAISLRLICDAPPLVAALERFPVLYQTAIVERFLWRLGITSRGDEENRNLVEAGEKAMIRGKISIADFFTRFQGGANAHPIGDDADIDAFQQLLTPYLPARPMTVPICDMLIEEVEAIWAAIAERDDWSPLQHKIDSIRLFGAALRNQSGL
jgi:serine/tyrosine/threonine adenylyltransferase